MAVFIPIFLWKIGYPLWQIVGFYFLKSVFFVALVYGALPLIKRLSDKAMMGIAIPFLTLYYFGLSQIDSIPSLFYFLPLLSAIDMLLFNVGYHMSFSRASEDGHIGREVGTRYMVSSLVQFSAPFLGATLITLSGFENAFMAGASLAFLSVVPLFFFPRHELAPRLRWETLIAFLRDPVMRPFNISGVGYAVESVIGVVLWPLFLFLVMGNIEGVGVIVSAGLLVTAIVTYLVGFLSDAGRRRKVLVWTAVMLSGIWAVRPFLGAPSALVGSHIFGNLSGAALMVSWTSHYYRIARALEDAGLFIVSRELLYHLARVAALPLIMLFAFMLPQSVFFIVTFLGAAALTLLFLYSIRLHTSTLDHHLDDYYLDGKAGKEVEGLWI